MSAVVTERAPVGLCATGLSAEVLYDYPRSLPPVPASYVEWRPFCPVDSNAPDILPDLCGLIGGDKYETAKGFCACKTLWPLLPRESVERLRDAPARDNFFLRVFVLYRWRLLTQKLSVVSLRHFYSCHKYLVMSRDVSTYRRLGPLLAQVTPETLTQTARSMIELILNALERPETRAGATNALQHMRGYLKRHLSRAEQFELNASIERYRLGAAALSEPLQLLRRHFHAYPDDYIGRQVFLWSDQWNAFFEPDNL